MGFFKLLLVSLLCGGTIMSTAATLKHYGISRAEHPEGISLRQESVRSRGFFPYYIGSRYHRGGGLRGGK